MSRGAPARPVLLIDGIDGSGKSFFADRLTKAVQAAGQATLLLSVDDFRRPVDWGAAESEADIYWERYFDLALAGRCLDAFARGEPGVRIPIYDGQANLIRGDSLLDLQRADALLIEGVFTLRIPGAASAPVVYLRASFEQAARRILTRDVARGRAAEEVERRMRERYFPCQRRYLSELCPAERADVLVDNEDPVRPRILRLELQRIAPALRVPLLTVLGAG